MICMWDFKTFKVNKQKQTNKQKKELLHRPSWKSRNTSLLTTKALRAMV